MFTGITTEMCAQAGDMITPAIERVHSSGLLNGFKGGVVVLDPADASAAPISTAHLSEDPHSLVEWATAKARVAARTGLDAAYVRDHSPHLYRAGDITWPGGIMREGLVGAIRAICQIEFAAPDGPRDNGGPYLRK